MKNHDFMREAAIALEAVMRVPKKAPSKSRSSEPATSKVSEVINLRNETHSEQIKQHTPN